MHHFYWGQLPHANAGAAIALYDREVVAHLRALRITREQPVRLFGPHGRWLEGTHDRQTGEFRVSAIGLQPPPAPATRLLLPRLEKNREADLFPKLAEIGVGAVIHYTADYSRVGASTASPRLRALCIAGCEQSGNLRPPRLFTARAPLRQILHPGNRLKNKQLFVALKSGEPLSTLQKRIAANSTEINPVRFVLIGPEGGFSPEETRLFARWQKAGRLFAFRLGTHVLRVETAAILAIAAFANL